MILLVFIILTFVLLLIFGGISLVLSLIFREFQWRNPEAELPKETILVLCETMSGNLVSGYIGKNSNGKAIIVTEPGFHFEDYDGYLVKRWKYIKR
jgi:hypothetical protein